MTTLKRNKVKLVNKDSNTWRNPDSTLGIYLTSVKVVQCRQVAANRREMEEAKNITSKKTATRKVHFHLKRSEDFDRCINSINSVSLSITNEESFIRLIQQLYNTIKDAIV